MRMSVYKYINYSTNNKLGEVNDQLLTGIIWGKPGNKLLGKALITIISSSRF
jgi:hypothetical protein